MHLDDMTHHTLLHLRFQFDLVSILLPHNFRRSGDPSQLGLLLLLAMFTSFSSSFANLQRS